MAAGWGAIDEVGQITQAAQLLERRIVLELVGQQDRLRQLTLANVGLDGLKQPLVKRLVEATGLQVVAETLVGGVVVQQDAQQRLLGFHVVRRHVDRGLGKTGENEIERGYERHRKKLTRLGLRRSGRMLAPVQMNGDVLCMFWFFGTGKGTAGTGVRF